MSYGNDNISRECYEAYVDSWTYYDRELYTNDRLEAYRNTMEYNESYHLESRAQQSCRIEATKDHDVGDFGRYFSEFDDNGEY